MHYFDYKKAGTTQKLFAEGVSIERIAAEVGTPVFIYSQKTLVRHYRAFDSAFKGTPHIVCFSVKANSNGAILKTLSTLGSGFDIVSGGELMRVIKAGGDPSKVVFSGVGKTTDELRYALKQNILIFNVESPQELRALNEVAGRLRKKARVALRVNPDVDPRTHPYISTGLKKNKFGIEAGEALRQYVYARKNYKNLDMVGVDCHIGSQITKLRPFVDALKKVKAFIGELRGEGLDISYLDMGGGLGITYEDEDAPHPSAYGEAILKVAGGLGLTLIFEPGRVIAGNAGILVTRVIYTKEGATNKKARAKKSKNFIITDAAMNDLPRPSLYGSFHEIVPVVKRRRRSIKADVVGPICESGDFLALGRTLPAAEPGELLAVMSAGAYCSTMASNYNSRARATEVMVRGREYFVVRKRERIEELVRDERLPKRLFGKLSQRKLSQGK